MCAPLTRIVSLVLALALATLAPVLADARRDSVLKCASITDGSAEAVAFSTLDDENRPVPIRGLLSKPKGQGPFPAIAMLHRYFGLLPPNCYSAGRKVYYDLGYVVLLIDSDSVAHAGRGQIQSINDYSFQHQSRDAVTAHAYLAKLPFVDEDRIVLVGYAYGGSSALRGLFPTSSGEVKPKIPFAAIVAWHPHCPDELRQVRVPLMVIAAGKDTMNWTSRRCKAMVRVGPAAEKFELLIFPEAGHNFDAWFERNYDAGATKLAYERLAGFLSKHLTTAREK